MPFYKRQLPVCRRSAQKADSDNTTEWNEFCNADQDRINSSSADGRRNGVRSRDQGTRFLHSLLFAIELRRYTRMQHALTRIAFTGMDCVEI